MLRIAAFGLALLSITGFLLQCSPAPTNAPAQSVQPAKIQLMTSLPIVWGEGASMETILSGEAVPSPIYDHWQQQHDITAVDSFEGLEASNTDVVLLAQPPAMDPADIAAVDAWVRAGGKAVIFTDPMLAWPTTFPLGDKRRPLASSLLSPLLSHWGLELLAPDEAEAGGVELEFPDATITTVGIGTFKFVSEPKSDHGDCTLSVANVIARCKVGKGKVIILADADFLNDSLWIDDVGQVRDDARRLTGRLLADIRE